MSNDYEIRVAEAGDAPIVHGFVKKLAEFERMADKMVASVDDFAKALAEKRIYAVILTSSGEAVGCGVYFFTFTTFAGKPKLFVEDIIVDPDHRRKGYGSVLLKEMTRIANETGCIKLELQVLDWNEDAVDFYESFNAEFVTNWLPYAIDREDFAEILSRN